MLTRYPQLDGGLRINRAPRWRWNLPCGFVLDDHVTVLGVHDPHVKRTGDDDATDFCFKVLLSGDDLPLVLAPIVVLVAKHDSVGLGLVLLDLLVADAVLDGPCAESVKDGSVVAFFVEAVKAGVYPDAGSQGRGHVAWLGHEMENVLVPVRPQGRPSGDVGGAADVEFRRSPHVLLVLIWVKSRHHRRFPQHRDSNRISCQLLSPHECKGGVRNRIVHRILPSALSADVVSAHPLTPSCSLR